LPKENIKTTEELTFTKLIHRLNACWQACEFGAAQTDCGNVVLLTEDLNSEQISHGLSKSDFDQFFEKFNYCNDCNVLVTGSILPPALVHITCNENNNRQLKVSGN
jgi:hypothetical protein